MTGDAQNALRRTMETHSKVGVGPGAGLHLGLWRCLCLLNLVAADA